MNPIRRRSTGRGRGRDGLLTAFGLLGLTIGVATLRGPARGAEDGPRPRPAAEAAAPEARDQASPSVPIYLREDADGVAVIRPAAAFRHTGMDRLLAVIEEHWTESISPRSRSNSRSTPRGPAS